MLKSQGMHTGMKEVDTHTIAVKSNIGKILQSRRFILLLIISGMLTIVKFKIISVKFIPFPPNTFLTLIQAKDVIATPSVRTV